VEIPDSSKPWETFQLDRPQIRFALITIAFAGSVPLPLWGEDFPRFAWGDNLSIP